MVAWQRNANGRTYRLDGNDFVGQCSIICPDVERLEGRHNRWELHWHGEDTHPSFGQWGKVTEEQLLRNVNAYIVSKLMLAVKLQSDCTDVIRDEF